MNEAACSPVDTHVPTQDAKEVHSYLGTRKRRIVPEYKWMKEREHHSEEEMIKF